jgi:hypothetical protein
MVQKVVKKCHLNDLSSTKEDLAFWLKKSPEERVAAVDYLRRQYHESTTRLQRVACVIQQTQR